MLWANFHILMLKSDRKKQVKSKRFPSVTIGQHGLSGLSQTPCPAVVLPYRKKGVVDIAAELL